jgi:hypothetical protein
MLQPTSGRVHDLPKPLAACCRTAGIVQPWIGGELSQVRVIVRERGEIRRITRNLQTRAVAVLLDFGVEIKVVVRVRFSAVVARRAVRGEEIGIIREDDLGDLRFQHDNVLIGADDHGAQVTRDGPPYGCYLYKFEDFEISAANGDAGNYIRIEEIDLKLGINALQFGQNVLEAVEARSIVELVGECHSSHVRNAKFGVAVQRYTRQLACRCAFGTRALAAQRRDDLTATNINGAPAAPGGTIMDASTCVSKRSGFVKPRHERAL